jgi:isocitrate dehydrogenase
MVKKSAGAIGGTSPKYPGGTSSTNPKSKTMSGTRRTRSSETKRPSALLDTRVVYYGDNLE